MSENMSGRLDVDGASGPDEDHEFPVADEAETSAVNRDVHEVDDGCGRDDTTHPDAVCPDESHLGEVVVDEVVVDEVVVEEVIEAELLEPIVPVAAEERLIRSLIGLTTATTITSLRLTGWAAGTAVAATRQVVQVATEAAAVAKVVATEVAREAAAEAARESAQQSARRRDVRAEQDRPMRRVRSSNRTGASTRVAVPGRGTTADGIAQLRARGDQLLERSADVRDRDDLHPAYDRILDQLAPDEARVLRLLAVSGAQPSVDIRTGRPFGIGSEMVGEGLSMIGELAGCRHLERTSAYLHNLHRLGLVSFSHDAVDLDRYQVVEVQPAMTEALKKAGRSAKIVRRSVRLTSFGEDFCRTCFSLPGMGSALPVL
ncbi:Abi-alpha family protein [Rhodococcus kronopolitis]|uniref:Abi-alpha family protein n=1 Tax=Rhodococcus kronopolitis TaxID=1460226 RepID=A0ABV9FPF5_9NOCA